MAFSSAAATEHLRRAHEQNRLAHAYLISGPPGSGKREVAMRLASWVNGTPIEDVFSSKAREIFVAEPESKSRRILIEQIRELEHALQMQATNGKRKIVIVSEADRLQPQAANAFLKTLEEPPQNSLLLLLSSLPEALPDTIVSRCIAIPLSPAGIEEPASESAKLVELLGEVAKEKTWSVPVAYRLAQAVLGLLAAIREEVKEQIDAALDAEKARYRNATDGAWLEDREEYYKALSESLYLQRRAAVIEILFQWWSDVLRAGTGIVLRDLPGAKNETEAVAKRFSTNEALRRIRRLESLRDHLSRNIQEPLAIEVAFLQIFGTQVTK
ncbi:MAG TPA: AAA family ATPase [Chthoniobacterales bacterium]|nr:AAA family ATPase [Chthoniobacterales bacterium]